MSDKTEIVYPGKFLQMLKAGRWEYAHRVGNVSAVGVIAVTEAKELLLVEQYRIPVQTRTIELPAGLVGDDDSSEEILIAAARELEEETGYQAERWQYLFDGPSSAGMTDEQMHLVLATGLRQTGKGGGVVGEDITVHHVPLAQLDAFCNKKRETGLLVDLKVRLAGFYLRCLGVL